MIKNFNSFKQMKVLLNNELIALPIPTPDIELQIGSVIIIQDGEYIGVYNIDYYLYYQIGLLTYRFPNISKINIQFDMTFIKDILPN